MITNGHPMPEISNGCSMFDLEQEILDRAAQMGFDQTGNAEVARFIGALVRMHQPAQVLELGTGLGMTTFHILQNLSDAGHCVSVENEAPLFDGAQTLIGSDPRLDLRLEDGAEYLLSAMARGDKFDFIFADTWPGKYTYLEEALSLLAPGGLYLIDDMTIRPNWPEGHAAKAEALIAEISSRADLRFIFLETGSGIGIAQKIAFKTRSKEAAS